MVMKLVCDNSTFGSVCKLVGKFVQVCQTGEATVKLEIVNDNNGPTHLFLDVGSDPIYDQMKILLALGTLSGVSIKLPDNESLYQHIVSWIKVGIVNEFKISIDSHLEALDQLLFKNVYVSPDSVSIADLAMYVAVHEMFFYSSTYMRTNYTNIYRWFAHMQSLPLVMNHVAEVPFIEMDKSNLTPNAAAPAETHSTQVKHVELTEEEIIAQRAARKAEKKKKQSEKKQTDTDTTESQRPVEDITRVEMRVGYVEKVYEHTGADTLFVEEIDIGEPSGPRTICSGLRAHIAKEEILNSKLVVIANLKQKNFRGVMSNGMVLCGNRDGIVELCRPPADAPIGELVSFPGYTGTPDSEMSTKKNKDPFAAVAKDLIVDAEGYGCYKNVRLTTSAGPCRCTTVTMGHLS